MKTETIAECDLCGRVDHHLWQGVCPQCIEMCGGQMHDYEPLPALDEEAAALGRAIVSDDEIQDDGLPGGLTPEQLRANDAALRNARTEPTAICTRCERLVLARDMRRGHCPWCRFELWQASQQERGKPT